MPKDQTKEQVGIIGLGTMGQNLARNFANKEVQTVVFNRTYAHTQEFLRELPNLKIHSSELKNIIATKTLKEFVQALTPPRTIILLVKAGGPVDAVLQQLTPLLSKDDSVMDFGNSDYPDTQRRAKEVAEKGVHFWGCGISGGEEGALHGPSLMPGGEKSQWPQIESLLSKVAARDFQNKPCVTFLGPGGAGHFVKTVHNGIEYAIMQCIAETYGFLRDSFALPAPLIADQFESWNTGPLQSFLLETTVKVLRKEDSEEEEESNKEEHGGTDIGNLQGSRDFSEGAVSENTARKKNPDDETKTNTSASSYLIDKVLDKAGMKGTGIWTVREAMENGAPAPGIAEAVFARAISSQKELREKLEKLFKDRAPDALEQNMKENITMATAVTILHNALYASTLISFAQGFDLIAKASTTNNWDIDLAEVARIWQGGCIIRAQLLQTIQEEFKKATTSSSANAKTQPHLLTLPTITKELSINLPAMKKVADLAIEDNIPMPTTIASLQYVLEMTRGRGTSHIIQGLRDAFGAHTYERTDQKGSFHTDW